MSDKRRLWQNADGQRAAQKQNSTFDVKRQEQAQNGKILTCKRADRTRRREVWLQVRAQMSGWHSPEVIHIFPHFSGRTNKGNYSALCGYSDRWNINYMKYRNTETVPILTSSQSNQDNRKDTDTLTSTAELRVCNRKLCMCVCTVCFNFHQRRRSEDPFTHFFGCLREALRLHKHTLFPPSLTHSALVCHHIQTFSVHSIHTPVS